MVGISSARPTPSYSHRRVPSPAPSPQRRPAHAQRRPLPLQRRAAAGRTHPPATPAAEGSVRCQRKRKRKRSHSSSSSRSRSGNRRRSRSNRSRSSNRSSRSNSSRSNSSNSSSNNSSESNSNNSSNPIRQSSRTRDLRQPPPKRRRRRRLQCSLRPRRCRRIGRPCGPKSRRPGTSGTSPPTRRRGSRLLCPRSRLLRRRRRPNPASPMWLRRRQRNYRVERKLGPLQAQAEESPFSFAKKRPKSRRLATEVRGRTAVRLRSTSSTYVCSIGDRAKTCTPSASASSKASACVSCGQTAPKTVGHGGPHWRSQAKRGTSRRECCDSRGDRQ
mmetsp:Transcript_15249/g.44077  ORF Transcript_15249/g.44077 Transcript_15249/m.44077 type:complete len:331 (-) Transcript_15249:264-1256(-)